MIRWFALTLGVLSLYIWAQLRSSRARWFDRGFALDPSGHEHFWAALFWACLLAFLIAWLVNRRAMRSAAQEEAKQATAS